MHLLELRIRWESTQIAFISKNVSVGVEAFFVTVSVVTIFYEWLQTFSMKLESVFYAVYLKGNYSTYINAIQIISFLSGRVSQFQ